MAHLQTKDVLSPEQVAHYDRLRGYTGQGGQHHGGGKEQHEGSGSG